jgi:hypothetical protein
MSIQQHLGLHKIIHIFRLNIHIRIGSDIGFVLPPEVIDLEVQRRGIYSIDSGGSRWGDPAGVSMMETCFDRRAQGGDTIGVVAALAEGLTRSLC